ncbi:MAG: TetR/AcrR family transcriptional regulator [Sulfuritalea sp.]|jgi:AcrR family transcriptional regulator|nr:TetR/AcrR family transcriptional regulator [Sulfuritalea sp.]
MAGEFLGKTVRRRRKDARPSELTAAALQLFIEKGYAATRLDDIAARAGVVKGTLYLYFDSKEALFNAVVREGLVPALSLSEWKERIADYAGSSPDLLREVILDFWRVVGSGQAGGLLKLVLSEAGNSSDFAHIYHDAVIAQGIDLLRAVIARGMARGEFRAVDTEAVAHIVMAPLLMRMIWEHSLGCGVPGVPTKRYLAEYLELMLSGLRSGCSPNR